MTNFAPNRNGGIVYAPPALSPEAGRGSVLHNMALRIVDPLRGRRPPLFRRRGIDRFHRLKLRYLVRQRHFLSRAANYALYRLERGRRARVHYIPPSLNLEANGSCNLRCPGCVTGLGLPAGDRKKRATLGFMTKVIDAACTRCFQINFYRQGEPLLNSDMFAASRYAVAKGLWTAAHSNLSFDLPRLTDSILESRLCNLVVSCDGATQQIYEKYRRFGDVDRVFHNIAQLAAARAKARAAFPWITAKFVVFDHNWHEIPAYRDRALGAGADDVLFVAGFAESIYATGRAASEIEFDLASLSWARRRIGPFCYEIWDSMGMDHDGGILPCCYAYTDAHLFAPPLSDAALSGESRPTDTGGARTQGKLDLLALWNAPSYLRAREYFVGNARSGRSELPGICRDCEYALVRERRGTAAADRRRSSA